MTLLIIAIICVLDIAARTYITAEGIRYETPSGKQKWIIERRGQGNGKNAK